MADVHADRSARSGHRLRFENVRTPEQGDFVEGHDGVDRAGADDTEGAAKKRDRDGLFDARGHGSIQRVEAEVIPDQGAVIDLERRGVGQRTRVEESQGAATDNRLSTVVGNGGERRGIVTRTDKVEVAGDRTTEGTANSRGEGGKGKGGVTDRAAVTGGRVRAREGTEGL